MEEVLHQWTGDRGLYRIVRCGDDVLYYWSVQEVRDGRWVSSVEENAYEDLLEEFVRVLSSPPTAQKPVLS